MSSLCAQSLQVTAPNGGETLLGGSTQNITWNYTNINNIVIELSLDGGFNWDTLSHSYSASALNYSFTVPSKGTTQGMVRLTSTLQYVQDESDGYFSIPTPTVDIEYPTGGESFASSSGQYVSWQSYSMANVVLEYTTDNGASWINIGTFNASDNYANWATPTATTNQARIRAYNPEDNSNRDSSAAVFNITALPSINTDKYFGGSFDGYAMASSLSDTIYITYPNGGEVFLPTDDVNITWQYRNLDNIKLEYSTDNGTSWNVIAANINASTQNYSWIVPNQPSIECLIKATALDRAVEDISNNNFTIQSSSITVTYPNGGEIFAEESGQYIEWTYSAINTVKAEYSIDGGANWVLIGTAPAADKYINWELPTGIHANCLIRLSDNDTPSLFDESDASFSTADFPVIDVSKYYGGSYDGYAMANNITDSILVTSPNGGEVWLGASTHDITWNYNNVDNVSIEYSLGII